jgi:hypothetical protein
LFALKAPKIKLMQGGESVSAAARVKSSMLNIMSGATTGHSRLGAAWEGAPVLSDYEHGLDAMVSSSQSCY